MCMCECIYNMYACSYVLKYLVNQFLLLCFFPFILMIVLLNNLLFLKKSPAFYVDFNSWC